MSDETLVLGLGISGCAASEGLISRGYKVCAVDDSPSESINEWANKLSLELLRMTGGKIFFKDFHKLLLVLVFQIYILSSQLLPELDRQLLMKVTLLVNGMKDLDVQLLELMEKQLL